MIKNADIVRKQRHLNIFSNKKFLYLWIAQFLSQISISFLNFVLVISAYEAVKVSTKVLHWDINTNLAAAYIVASYGLASIIFGAPAGVLVDHYDRKKMLLYTTFFRSVFVLFLLLNPTNLLFLIVFTFVLNSISQFFYPAEAAMIPQIVEKKDLIQANSIYNLTYFASHILGPLVGVFTLFNFGLNATLVIISLTFLTASISIHFINYKDLNLIKIEYKYFFKQITIGVLEGISHIRDNFDTKISLIYLGIVQIIIGIFWALQPGISIEILNIDIKRSGIYIILPLVIGVIFGTIFINKYAKLISRKLFIESGITLLTISFLGIYLLDLQFKFNNKIFNGHAMNEINRIRDLPYINILTLGVILMFVIGFASSFIFIIYNTKLQTSTKNRLRGSIYGILQTIVTVSGAVPIILSGYIADKYGVKDVFLGMSLFVLILHLLLKYRYKVIV